MDQSVTVIADSISDTGVRLATIECLYPRIILAEVNTHRVLSRNGASSRAIPFRRLVEMMQENHFSPIEWLYNDKGMASTLVMSQDDSDACDDIWQDAMADAIKHARRLHERRASKQYMNRLLEPFLMTRTLISSTRWTNLMTLRDHADAQPEFRDLAKMIKEAMGASSPALKTYGDGDAWHLPYMAETDMATAAAHEGDKFDIGDLSDFGFFGCGTETTNAIGMAVARCCRVSGKTFDGEHPSFESDVSTFKRLSSTPLHASPMEHVAYPSDSDAFEPSVTGNFHGWFQFRHFMPNESTDEVLSGEDFV